MASFTLTRRVQKYNNVAKKGKATIFYVYLCCFKIQVAALKGAVAPGACVSQWKRENKLENVVLAEN